MSDPVSESGGVLAALSRRRRAKRPTQKPRCAAPKRVKRKQAATPKARRSGLDVRASAKRTPAKPKLKPCRKPGKAKPKPKTPPKAVSAPPPSLHPPVKPVPVAVPPPVPVPLPPPPPAASTEELTAIRAGIPVYDGQFGRAQAERLLWRAGFGPRRGEGEALAALGLREAVRRLTQPVGQATLDGPEPTRDDGSPLTPTDAWGDDHLYWLDRMARTSQPLVERMALVLHDWFATRIDNVGSQRRMLDQTNLFRAHGLGSFRALVVAITRDPAMILMLNQASNRRGAINENYARELMELFTLGADRGAYTESDVRELARVLSGWRNDWTPELGNHNFRWDVNRWDPGTKTVFGKTGAFAWEDACRLVVEHSLHPSFFVAKLWSYFIAEPPPAAVAEQLAELYSASGYEIRPVLEAILLSPQLYAGGAMVKPPVVAMAGLLRARNRAVEGWGYIDTCARAGQRLYYPPDVAGWNDERWLDTSTVRARWDMVARVLAGSAANGATYPAESAAEAVARAREFWGDPSGLTAETVAALEAWAADAIPTTANSWLRVQRQHALRQLVGASPDLQIS